MMKTLDPHIIQSVKGEDFYWLVGILEGEGCFSSRKKTYSPYIVLQMTDKDVVDRVGQIWGKTETNWFRRRARPHYKDIHITSLSGEPAARWMIALQPYMGARRKERIRQALCRYIAKWM